MKDSGVVWLGEIPKHWEVKRLKYVLVINKKTLSESTPNYMLINYIDISSVDSKGNIIKSESLKFQNAPSRARRVISSGDTIISTVRTYLKAVAFIEKSNDSLICSTGFAVLSPKISIYSKYLYYMVRSTQFVDEVVARSVGISYPAINCSELSMLSCVVPSLKEQQEIAEYLDKQTIKIDNLTNKIEQQISNLKEYRQALISNAVTGKIDVREVYQDE